MVENKPQRMLDTALHCTAWDAKNTGVALTGDPDYRIVMEAYPFVTRKIISDDSPALQRALRDILYR